MPATLHFSNSLDALADRLIENIRDAGGDPFRAPSIATPASAMRDWLKVRIAEKRNIAVNIAFPHLERLLWDLLAERDPAHRIAERQPARMLDTFSFQGLLLTHLSANPPAALRAYLDVGDTAEGARKRVQLAGRLAALFREYEYSRVAENGRPGLAGSWMHGERCFDRFADHPDIPELESWQMEIYRALFRKEDGLRDRWGDAAKGYRYTLPQFAQMVLGTGSSAKRPELKTPATVSTVYHLFGLSNISPFHRDLIGQLADANRLGSAAVRFEIYALNPCAEFWEDTRTEGERRARARHRHARKVPVDVITGAQPAASERDRGVIDDAASENKLLALFGKPGRETIKLWCQLTEHAFEDDFRVPESGKLLGVIQKSVLSRLGPLPEADAEAAPEDLVRVSADDSVRLFAAPDARTELEAVRDEMAQLLRKEPGLRPEDFALIPADPDAAMPVIRAVFAGGRESAGNVPVLLPGADSSAESPLLRGFRALLSPAVLAADRNAILALLENPALRTKAGIAGDRLRAVREYWTAAGFQEGWGDETGPVHSGGEQVGEQVGKAAVSTALAAEERALLARVFDTEDASLTEGDYWPAHGVNGLLERAETARVIDWLARLRVALHPFRIGDDAFSSTAQTWAQWAAALRALLAEFLKAAEEFASDQRAERELNTFFTEMESWDRWAEPADRVSADLVRTLFEDAFRAPGSTRTAFLRGGVRVGGISELRGLPFRHVWVTGLAAGVFPAPSDAAPLDLRSYRRLPGESDPTARDLYALLEVLASATESISLSWVRRDAAKDAEVSPSRAITGLKAWLESEILPEGEEFPVRLLHAAPLPAETEAVRRSHAATWAVPPLQEIVRVNWTDLARFLENPALHAARSHFRLNAYDALDFEEEERAATLFLDRRDDRPFREAVLRAELVAPGSGEATFERLWNERARGGLLPPPPYDTVEYERLHTLVTGKLRLEADHLRSKLAAENLAFAGSLRMGPQDGKTVDPPSVSLPEFDARLLENHALDKMRLVGVLPWFFQGSGPDGGWAVLLEEGQEIAAYLLQLSITALGGAPDKTVSSVRLHGPGFLIRRSKDADKSAKAENAYTLYPLRPLEPEAARTQLKNLLLDITQAPRFDDLPLNGIESLLEKTQTGETSEGVEDWSEAIEAWRRDEQEASFGGPKFWDRILGTLATAVPRNANVQVVRRALPYIAWKQAWNPPKKQRGKSGASADESEETGEDAT